MGHRSLYSPAYETHAEKTSHPDSSKSVPETLAIALLTEKNGAFVAWNLYLVRLNLNASPKYLGDTEYGNYFLRGLVVCILRFRLGWVRDGPSNRHEALGSRDQFTDRPGTVKALLHFFMEEISPCE